VKLLESLTWRVRRRLFLGCTHILNLITCAKRINNNAITKLSILERFDKSSTQNFTSNFYKEISARGITCSLVGTHQEQARSYRYEKREKRGSNCEFRFVEQRRSELAKQFGWMTSLLAALHLASKRGRYPASSVVNCSVGQTSLLCVSSDHPQA
jgi:hypothetical protein